MKSLARIDPEEYVLSVLTEEDRLEAAFKLAKEAFKKSKLTSKNINQAIKTLRGKLYRQTRAQSRR